MILVSISPELWGAIAVVVAAIIGGIATIVSSKVKTNKAKNFDPGVQSGSKNDNVSSLLESQLESRGDKSSIHILFIDDEKFENVSILKNAGWLNTRSIKDIKRIDSPEIRDSDVIFVDINGVGTTLFPKEQGLGVATQIKKLFPKKFVVVYSAQPQQLHSSFSQVDAILPKNAEPYEYLSILETYLDQRR
jgi:hypothetical protein